MADAKITELTELTTPALGDVIAIVDDPGGSPVTKKMALSSLVIDDDTMATASATNVPTSESTKAYVDNGTWLKDSMSRQAIINGNFDVWQRGTSFSISSASNIFSADRFAEQPSADGGTLPTLTRSRQIITSGALYNSFYCSRLAFNGAGTSLGVNSLHKMDYKIEYGVRSLCGDGKKVTLSFWAKSDVANKKIGVFVYTNYGTGGSPSSTEIINGGNFTLTSNWTKYTITITTNTLSGKTFGTDNNDYFQLAFTYMWGSSLAYLVGAGTTAETYVGSGFVDIAQVQLCAGDVALPFMPKSFEEELRACQRYYYHKLYICNIAASTSTLSGQMNYPVQMRATPTTISLFSTLDTANKLRKTIDNSEITLTTPTFNISSSTGYLFLYDSGGTPMTAGISYDGYIRVSAEL